MSIELRHVHAGLGLSLLRALQADALGFFVDLAAEHGHAVAYRIGPEQIVQLSHPSHHQAVLATRAKSFRKPARLRKVLSQWNGNGLVTNEGDSWVRQRRMIQPSFKPGSLQRYAAIAARHSDALIASWHEEWQEERRPNISHGLARLSLGVVAESLFGSASDRFAERLEAEVAVLNEGGIRELSSLLILPMWFPSPSKRRLRRATDFLRGVVDEMIAARSPADDNLLTALMDAVDAEGDGDRMTTEQVRDEAVNLLLGGNETTAVALTWTLHCLSQHPDEQARIHDEVAAVVGDGEVSFAHVERLIVTARAIKEAMRIYPPVYVIPREAVEDVTIDGIDIAAGTQVNLVPYVTHRDPTWFPEPLAYRPERFAHESDWPKGAYLPFGLGPRACIGRRFAMMEAIIAVAKIVRAFSLSACEEPVLEAQVSLHPKGGLHVELTPRSISRG